jgi:uncharacterized protein
MTTSDRPRHEVRDTADEASSTLARRHPVTTFFGLTYLVSWTLWAPLIVLGDDLPGPLAFVLLMLGSLVPSTVALILVASLIGRRGVLALLHRLLKGRVGLRWYLAVLALPLLAPVALGLSILFGGPAPSVDNTILGVLVFFVFSIFPGSALGEEVGWRGFALPLLQARSSALRASLLIGVVWGCWHLPVWLASDVYPLSLFPSFVVSVIALSVLCTWIYNGTGGSLLLIVLLHAAANLPITVLITPLGEEMVQPFLIFTALMVVTAAGVVVATGSEHLSRSRRRQVTITEPSGDDHAQPLGAPRS